MLFRYFLIFLATVPAVLSRRSSSKGKTSKGKNKVVKESIRLSGVEEGTTTSASISIPQPDGSFASRPTIPGSLFIGNGSIVGKGDDPTYFFILSCTVLDGRIVDSPPGIRVDKQKCEVDVCLGINEKSDEPDCFYLRYSGFLAAQTNFGTGGQEIQIPPFKATITGGSGKYLLATGQGTVVQDVETIENIDIDLAYIPSPLAKVKKNGKPTLWN